MPPLWLQDEEHDEGAYEGGSKEDKKVLMDCFLNHMSKEWSQLYAAGMPYRALSSRLPVHAKVWSIIQPWIRRRIEWARTHPGEPFQGDDFTIAIINGIGDHHISTFDGGAEENVTDEELLRNMQARLVCRGWRIS